MRRNVIVIGASAGGVEALRAPDAGLPVDLPAVVLVALHVPPVGDSMLSAIPAPKTWAATTIWRSRRQTLT